MHVQVVNRGHQETERGAIMVLTALLIVVLAIFAGGTLSAVTLYGANQEGRRAADLTALSAAATLPTANLTSCNTAICNPVQLPRGDQFNTRLGTVDLDQAVPLPSTNWTTGACYVAGAQFGPGRSAITEHYKSQAPTCVPEAQWDQPWMDKLASCIQTVSNCTSVQNALAGTLPTPAGTALGTAIQAALTAADATQKLVSSTTMSTLNTLNNQTGLLGFCAAFGGPGCLTPLITALGGSQLSIDLASIAPALLTPQVKITVQQGVRLPLASLVGMGDQTVTNTAVARRAFKNAVLLPAISSKRGDGTYTINPNLALAAARNATLNALGAMDGVVSPLVGASLGPLMCGGPPAGTPCSVSSFIGSQLTDLNDLYNPPAGQPPPSGNQVLTDAISNGGPVLIATLGHAVRPAGVLNNTLWTALAPLLGLGLGDVLVAPALDFVPATLTDGGSIGYVATPVNTVQAAGQTKGLYRARLVD